jgi:hypothetical protein
LLLKQIPSIADGRGPFGGGKGGFPP